MVGLTTDCCFVFELNLTLQTAHEWTMPLCLLPLKDSVLQKREKKLETVRVKGSYCELFNFCASPP